MNKIFNKLLVRLRFKCPCGGWRTLLKRYRIHLADITFNDEVVDKVYLAMRPCKKCRLAVSRAKPIKLAEGVYRYWPPGTEVHAYAGDE